MKEYQKLMKHYKKKGFTIVELLTTIIILSLLMVVVIGSIAKILDNTTKKYYSSQESLVTLAGKEYFTDYRSKLPKKIANLEKVSLKTLIDKKYIEPVTAKNGTCYPEDSYVSAQKIDENDYQYYTYLSCDDYKSEKDSNKPIITFIPNEKTAKSAINVTMRITDNSDGILFYNYEVKSGENVIRPLDDDEQPYSGDKGIPIGEEVLPDQKKSYQITGYATDSSGNKTVKKSGIYTIDTNEAPVISSFSVNSQSSSYNTKNAKVTFTITDNTNDISYYFSTTGYEKGGSWTTCSASNKKCQYTNSSYSVSSKQDGTSKTFYLVAKDGAGNKVRKKVTYKVYNECSSGNTNSNTKNGSCQGKCGYGTTTATTTVTDKYTNNICSTSTKNNVSCYTGKDCCSSTTTSWSSWSSCSNSCGYGTQYRYGYKYSTYDGSYCGSANNQSQSCYSETGCPPADPCSNVHPNGSSAVSSCNCSTNTRDIEIYYYGTDGSYCYSSPSKEYCSCSSTTPTQPTQPTQPTTPTAKPKCSFSIQGKSGKGGWYGGNKVTINLTMDRNGGSEIVSYGMKTNQDNEYVDSLVSLFVDSTDPDGTYTFEGRVKNKDGKTGTCIVSVSFDGHPPYKPYHPLNVSPNNKTSCVRNFSSTANCNTSGKTSAASCTYDFHGSACGDTVINREDQPGGSGHDYCMWYSVCPGDTSKNTGSAAKVDTWKSKYTKVSSCKKVKTEVYCYDRAGNQGPKYTYTYTIF